MATNSLVSPEESLQRAGRGIVSRHAPAMLLVSFVLLTLLAPAGAQGTGTNLGGSLAEQGASSDNGASLGDYARKVRENKKPDVQVKAEDAKELFHSLDEIMAFSSRDSGLPKLAGVKHKMIGRDEAQAYFAKARNDEIRSQRLEQSETVLKKFGMLPPDFDLKAFLAKNDIQNLGGFYSHEDKTLYLLNWISIDEQKPIMSHELTHALQDQNFHLSTYFGQRQASQGARRAPASDRDAGEIATARRAVVEGQAMIVFIDYYLAQMAKDYPKISRGQVVSLVETPRARSLLKNGLDSTYDSPVIFKNAPRLLKDLSIFPYREGLEFEIDLLERGGREMAFRTPYASPPVSTHEVLQSEAYFNGSKPSLQSIPDLSAILGQDWISYSSGQVGELDIQIFSQEHGRDNDIYTVARKWDGGMYLAVKRAQSTDAKTGPADLALVYVSRWKTRQAAERFAQIYLDSIPKRVHVPVPATPTIRDCTEASKCPGPLWEAHEETGEGPVNIELGDKNTLFITQSLDDATVAKIRKALFARSTPAGRKPSAALRHGELGMQLFESPAFEAFAVGVGQSLKEELTKTLRSAVIHQGK